MKSTVLFSRGVRDDRNVKVISIDKDLFAYNVGGSSNVFRFMESENFDKVLLTFDARLDSTINTFGSTILFNQISDFDTHKITLQKIDSMLDQLGENMVCLNRPEHIRLTTRDSIAELLQGIDGLIVPQTIRISPRSPDDIFASIKKSKMNYPTLLRESGLHGGQGTVRIETAKDANLLYGCALDGRDYYLTAIHDFSVPDDNGSLYKKYRLVVVDGKPFIRHLIISDNWMVHSDSRAFMDKNNSYADEESQHLKDFQKKITPQIQPIISAIHERIKLDYFGIDCHINEDGEILIFEINATMNILLNNADIPNKWQQPIETIRQAIIEMITGRINSQ